MAIVDIPLDGKCACEKSGLQICYLFNINKRGIMRYIAIGKETNRIVDFIRQYYNGAGFGKAVIGLSGGLDSSVSAALAALALGPNNVLGITMPYFQSSPQSLADAEELVAAFRIKHKVIHIDAFTQPYFDAHAPDANALRIGNWLARMRMCVLFDQAAACQALVLGTGNRSELLIGYFTQFGDAACAIEPIGHLYKTEVQRLAEHLGVPQSIIDKVPSADLWEGQTDEDEIGLGYPIIDRVLYDICEGGVDSYQEGLPYTREEYESVKRMLNSSAFKRSLPPMLEPTC